MDMFPQKVWPDCVKCPTGDRCDEIAVILQDEELAQFVKDHGES